MLDGLRRQWQEISPGQKVAAVFVLFVAPIAVGIVLIFIDRAIPSGTAGPAADTPAAPAGNVATATARPTPTPTPTRRPEVLEVVRTQILEATEDANGEPVPPTIDITLRNVGDTVAVLTAAEVTIRDVAYIAGCIPETGGPLGVSFAYGLALPSDAKPGSTYSADLSQSIAPNEADRIAIAIDAPELDGDPGDVLFVADVRLRHGSNATTEVGPVVIAYPFVPSASAFSASDIDFVSQEDREAFITCFQDNAADLRRVLAAPGEKPEGLTEALLEEEEPPADEDALNADEQDLEGGILRGAFDCSPVREGLPIGAIAGIECAADDDDVARIGFYRFDDEDAMLEAYFARMDAEGVQRDGSGCSAGEEENAYTPGEGEVADRHGCFVNDQGYANYRATISGDNVYIGILGRNADMQALEDFAWLGNQDTPGRPTLWSSSGG